MALVTQEFSSATSTLSHSRKFFDIFQGRKDKYYLCGSVEFAN